ncbi:GNAT family N-acetyltransferase [cyanobacterium TDX16]|nr:GNAT family N-acetyltransferase [cyanobacterium TDX16]
MVVRAAAVEDADTVAAIWAEGWRDGHLGHVHEELVVVRTDESFLARTRQRIAGTDDTMVAELGGDVVGFVMVDDDEVEQVYVAAAARGSGVAAALLDEAERRVRAAGHQAAWLAVVAGNARARRFYARCGWWDAGAFDYEAAGPDGPIVVPSHRYEKRLDGYG